MITFVRTAEIQDGKFPQAIEWALRVSAHLNETLGTNLTVQRNVAGPVNQVHWMATYESLAALEEIAPRLAADAGYQAMLAESTEKQLFRGQSIVDKLYQSLS